MFRNIRILVGWYKKAAQISNFKNSPPVNYIQWKPEFVTGMISDLEILMKWLLLHCTYKPELINWQCLYWYRLLNSSGRNVLVVSKRVFYWFVVIILSFFWTNDKIILYKGPFTYYVITFCMFLDPLPPSVIKFGIG